jgi:hypothetical protein
VTSRLVASALALAALGVHFGLVARQEGRAAMATDDYRRLRDERQQVAGRLARQARLENAQRRAGRLPNRDGALTPARAARLQIVKTLAGSGVSNVRIGVAPAGRPPLAVSVHLSGEGSFDDVLKLTGGVAGPGSGLLLQQVALEARDTRVSVSMDAVGVAQP